MANIEESSNDTKALIAVASKTFFEINNKHINRKNQSERNGFT